MKFKSKPTTIDAEQYWFRNEPPRGVCTCHSAGGRAPHVHTMHDNQMVLLKDGDWIVPEPDGEHFYPIDDAVFRKKYEPV